MGKLFEERIEKTLRNEENKIEYITPDEVAERYEKIFVVFAQESLKVCKNKKVDHSGRAKWMNKECFKEQKAFKLVKNEFMGA